MYGGIFDGGAAAGGKAVGAALIVHTAYRLFVFVCNFFAGRYDARQERLEALELRLSTSLGKRLAHLERAETNNQSRIRVLEDCVAILTTALRCENPNNPQLKEVGRMLANVHPLVAPDPKLEELMQHASRALDEDDGA